MVALLALNVAKLGWLLTMTRHWLGAVKSFNGVVTGSANSELITNESLNLFGINNGDRVSRILVDWSLWTQLEDNTSSLQFPPEAWAIGVSYTPNPDPSPDVNTTQPVEMLVADSLFSAVVPWEPARYTDGTLHATQWFSRATVVASQQGNRRIVDKSVAHLNFGIQSLSAAGFNPADYIPLEVHGVLRMKYLIEGVFD